MKHLYLSILTLAIIPFSANANDDIKIVPVKDNIHLLISPMGGNVTASTGKDGTFIIDDQLSGRSQIITDAIKGIANDDIKFVLNTHYHFDHTGGNEFLGERNAIIVAHNNVRKRLSTEQFITYFKKKMPPLSKAGLPSITFTNDMTLHYNNDDIQIIHLPAAHTDGDAAAYFTKANVIVTGDTVFNGMYPFIDTEHGGSFKGLLKAHNTLLTLANDKTIIVPGHGNLMNKADLQAYHDALSSILEAVETAIKSGKSLEETIAAKPTAKFDKKMGGGFIGPDVIVKTIYEDLSR